MALNRMVGAGDTRLECTDWLRDLRRVSRDAGLSAAPREPIPLPTLSCSAHECSTWKASATWVCNVCERMNVCLCVPSACFGSAAIVAFRFRLHLPFLLLQVGWVPPTLLGEEGGGCHQEHYVLSRAPAGAAPPALSLHNPPSTLPAQLPALHDFRGQNRTRLFLTFLSGLPGP